MDYVKTIKFFFKAKNRLLPGLLLLLLSVPGWLYANSDTQTLSLTFLIEPVTVVKISSPGKVVRIGPLVPGVDAPGENLQVSVATNTEDSYEVFHELRNEITSNSGGEFPKNELEFSVSKGKEGGTSLVPSARPVPIDRIPVFKSLGGPDLFTIQYIVINKKSFSAGSYYGNISITLENA